MPNYEWKHKITGEVKVIKMPMKHSDVPPDDSGDWERVYTTGGKVYADGWGSDRKGKYNSKGD